MTDWHGLLAGRLADRYRRTPAGHVARLNGLMPVDAREVCSLLRGMLPRETWDVVVVDDGSDDSDGLSIRIDEAIFRRNDKSLSRLYLVPQGQVTEAAASLADTEGHELTEHLAALSKGLLSNLPATVRPIVEAAQQGVRPSMLLDFLTSIEDTPTAADIGRELWRIGLIPDREPTRERILRNRQVMSVLSDERLAGGNVHARLSVAQVGPPELAEAIASRLRGRSIDDEWLREVGEIASLAFDQWEFPDDPDELRDVSVLSYYHANGMGSHPWTGLTFEEGTLKAFREGEPKRVTTRWKTDPEQPTRQVSYEVTLETCDPEPEILLAAVVKHRRASYQSWAFDPKEAPIESEGSLRVRVSVKALGGEEELHDQGFEFLLDNGPGPAPNASALTPVRCLAEFLFEQVEAGKFPDVTGIGRNDDNSVVVEVGGRHRRRIQLVPTLVEAERAVLEDPTIIRQRLPRSAEGVWSKTDLVRTVASTEVRQLLSEDWWRLRKRLFAAISAGGGLVESSLLAAHQAEISTYARGYATALSSLVNEFGPDTSAAALQSLLLIDTVYVADDDDETEGCTVLVSPLQPVRLLWHLSHELLLRDWAAKVGRPGPALRDAINVIDASGTPAYQSVAGSLFVPVSNVSFHWPQYVVANALDPSLAFDRVQRGLGMGGASAADWSSADVSPLANRIGEFLHLHPYIGSLKVDAINPGDGRVLIGALAQVDEPHRSIGTLDYEIGMYGQPPVERLGVLLDDVANTRKRALALPNRIEALFRSSGSYLRPHVAWSKRRTDQLPSTDVGEDAGSHVAIVLDFIGQRPTTLDESVLPSGDDSAVYGLVAVPSDHQLPDRTGSFTTVRIAADGPVEHHPVDRALSRELMRGHREMLRASAILSGGASGAWPGTEVTVSESQAAVLDRLHARSDWVITVDANAPVDYYDSPASQTASLRDNANRYVIDMAPSRAGTHRLMVSTSHVGELHGVLKGAMREMAITPTELAYEEVLRLLKSISGHIVMRLARDPDNAKEIVALAVVREILRGEGELATGFLVPIDDHQSILVQPGPGGSERRADLLVVKPGRARQLEVTIVEVKFRKHEYMARDAALAADMAEATAATEASMRRRFFPVDQQAMPHWPIGRGELRNLLDFHVARARRHGLIDDDAWDAAQRVLGGLQGANSTISFTHRGYVYCPSYAGESEPLAGHGIDVTLVGRGALPRYTKLQSSEPVSQADQQAQQVEATDPATADAEHSSESHMTNGTPSGRDTPPEPDPTSSAGHESEPDLVAVGDADPASPGDLDPPPSPAPTSELGPEVEPMRSPERGRNSDPSILLGHDPKERDISYKPSIKGNPHLLMVGTPGMGKTTALVNICGALADQSIFPFIIDFHGDITAALTQAGSNLEVAILDASTGIPFNPLEVDSERRTDPNGWKVQVHEISEILGNIFPSFGELQVGQIRDSLRQTYESAGYGAGTAGEAPRWTSFWDNLQVAADERSDVRKITTRLESIFDLGLFAERDGHRFATLDELLRKVTIIDLHRIQIEENQRVAASFFLHRLYRAMFASARPQRINTAVIIDEAHRIAKLKLLPRMLQESRKFGVAVIVSSQRVEDFDQGVLDSAGNHLYMRVNHPDARRLASYLATGARPAETVTQLQSLHKYHALFRSEDYQPFTRVRLLPPHGSRS